MENPVAHIRPITSNDEKYIQLMVGKACMEPLATANHQACTHPLVVATWLASSSVFIDFMNWWPDRTEGFLSFLRPLPAFASMALPFMFFIDWINRPYFEKLMEETVLKQDMNRFPSYYTNLKSCSAGFWVMEYGSCFVGLIALDTKADGSGEMEGNSEGGTTTKRRVGVIRHLHVEKRYRAANIQKDLLEHALKRGFGDMELGTIEVTDMPLMPYKQDCFRELNFKLIKRIRQVGILRWNLSLMRLERESFIY